jgi:hypothetical protein
VQPTNGHNRAGASRAAFSLAETLVAMSLASIVGAAVLSAYIFIARSTSRLANYQRLETESRRALQMLNSDFRMAVSIASPTVSSVSLTLPTSGGTTTVAYAYDPAAQSLVRNKAGTPPATMLTGVQSFTFNYYDPLDAVPASTQAIKQVEVSFVTTAGSPDSTAATHFTAASARMLLQNKRLMNGL